MPKLMLLGDEALAQGALGCRNIRILRVSGNSLNEIIEYAQKSKQQRKTISQNLEFKRKNCLEAALGMSASGKRAMVT
jgi:indolepyruvate ferredoxin oxidoreductase alpha subunit